jgi:SAM-dependent methyltransferase
MRDSSPAPFDSGIECPDCLMVLGNERGIWRALSPQQLKYYQSFLAAHQIGTNEGQNPPDAEFYLALPFKDLHNRNQRHWRNKARAFRYLEDMILPPIEAEHDNQPLLVLDLGAGNGWLSYRLALRSHYPIAIDLLADSIEGLGAASHYLQQLSKLFPRFQADMDHLPFASGQFDCAIFVESLQYSRNCHATLSEVIRCLRPGGTLLIANPRCCNEKKPSEEQINGRHGQIVQPYGTASGSPGYDEDLLDQDIVHAGRALRVSWRVHEPRDASRWSVSPLISRWKRSSGPSFRIYMGSISK